MPKSRSAHPKANKLDENQKRWIVQRLACFEALVAIARDFEQEFGFGMTLQGIQAYDPTKHSGRTLSKPLRAYFEETRAKFIEDAEARIPEMSKSVRLQMLAGAAREYREAGLYDKMASMLEQISKEVGGVYTNRREFTGKDGAAIQFENLSDQELEQQLAALLMAAADESESRADGRRRRRSH